MRHSHLPALAAAALLAACDPGARPGDPVAILEPAPGAATNGEVVVRVEAEAGAREVVLLVDGAPAARAEGRSLRHVLDTRGLAEGPHTLQPLAVLDRPPTSGPGGTASRGRTQEGPPQLLRVDRTRPSLTARLPVEGGLGDPAYPIRLTFTEPTSGPLGIRIDDGAAVAVEPLRSADGRTLVVTGLPLGPGRALHGHLVEVDVTAARDEAGNPAAGGPLAFRWVSQPRHQRVPDATAWEPALALAPDGAPHLAWSELRDHARGSGPFVELERWDGGAWSRVPFTTAGRVSGYGFEADLAFLPDGNPVVAATDADWVLEVTGGGAGGPRRLLQGTPGAWDFDPSVAVRGDRVAVSWTDEIPGPDANSHSYCGDVSVALASAGEWTPLGGRLNPEGECGDESVVALDGQGTPWIAWAARELPGWGGGSIRVARWTGSAWEVRADFPNWVGHDLAVDDAGAPLLLLSDLGGLRLVRFDGAGWTLVGESDAPAQSGYNRPALSPASPPAAAWSEADGLHVASLDGGALVEVGGASIGGGVFCRDAAIVREAGGTLWVAFTAAVPGANLNPDTPIYTFAIDP